MKVRCGNRELEAGGRYFRAELRESNDILGDIDVLRSRMAEDGYLLIRGLRDREGVMAARRQILANLASRGLLDPDAPLMEGIPKAGSTAFATTSVRQHEEVKRLPDFLALFTTPSVQDFFDRFLGGRSAHLDFKWLRIAGPGAESPIHGDSVFMGRGTPNLYTCWTPIGDVSLEMGPIVLCLGSHRLEKIKNTYGRMDVDRDLIQGWLSKDPVDFVDRFGGQWATTSFQAGDVLIFGMHLLHASLSNTSGRLRISVDARYQLASEPFDERWIGKEPIGHYNFWKPGIELEPIEKSWARWGL